MMGRSPEYIPKLTVIIAKPYYSNKTNKVNVGGISRLFSVRNVNGTIPQIYSLKTHFLTGSRIEKKLKPGQ